MLKTAALILKSRRIDRRLTPRQIARAIGISERTVWRVESSGKLPTSKGPRADYMKMLGLTEDELNRIVNRRHAKDAGK